MAAFTAQDVKELREKTGVGMMECKKALTEAEGSIDRAIEILRERGEAKAVSKSGRIAAEGVVHASVKDDVGVVLEVNAETDFVAKNQEFQDFVEQVALVVAENNPTDVTELLELQYGGGKTVAEAVSEKIQKIGENIKIRRFKRAKGPVSTYVHSGGSIGVLVEFDTDLAGKPGFDAFAKDIALQIAASNPQYMTRDQVPQEEAEKEREIMVAQAVQEGKPKEIAEKMVQGRMNKFFFGDICLLEQPYVKDDKLSIGQFVDKTAKELGGRITIKDFVRFEKGEGIEKKDDDFAAEVASMVK